MGSGFGIICKHCKYEFRPYLGVGRLFPAVYNENVNRMKKGELGPEAKQFFIDHPDGVINSESVVAKCRRCGNYDEVDDLTMYIPKEGKEMPDVSDGIYENDIPEFYEKFMEYPHHRCSKCGGPSKVYKSFVKKAINGNLKCPQCGEMIGGEGIELILWD